MSSRALTFALGAQAGYGIGDPPTRVHPVGLVGQAARGLQCAAPAAPEPRRRYGGAVALALPLSAALSAAVVRRSAARRGAAAGMLAEALRAQGLRIASSRANFLIVEVGAGAAFRRELLLRGFAVRDCASFALPRWVRVAADEAAARRLIPAFLEALRSVRGPSEFRS